MTNTDKLQFCQPPDFGWRADSEMEALRLHALWAWHNGQSGWTAEDSGFPEGAD